MAKSPPGPKIVVWPKLATFFDLRSTPDAVPWGRWRYVQNMTVFDGVWRRRSGWRRYGWWMTYPDSADLPMAVDVLYQHTHPTGQRRLFAATATNIYSQAHDGIWSELGHFDAGDRFQFASVETMVFATNNLAEPVYQTLDDAPDEDGQAFHPIPDLQKIAVTKAGMVGSWQGILFFGNVTMDFVQVGHRLLWSDRNNPLKFEPSTDNVAGFQDLDPGEVILAGVPMADAFFIFTTRSIWRVTMVGGTFFLNFQQVYTSRTGSSCLMSRDSLVVWRNTAVYFANDGIYIFNAFATAPEQPAWLYHATKNISYIDPNQCRMVVSGLRAVYGEIWFSYPSSDLLTKNDRTVVLNMDYEAADEVDHGFSALLPVSPDDSMEVAEWLISAGGCSSADVEELFPGTSEGRPVIPAQPVDVEDFCGNPANFPKCDVCPKLERFIVASTADGALKDVDLDYFAREYRVSAGVYSAEGYGSRFVTGALHFDKTEWKRLEDVQFDLIVPATDEPRDLNLTISTSATPVDVLAPLCRAKAFVLKPRKLQCPGTGLPADQPNAHFRWPVLVEGRYLYLDFSVPAVTGGAFQASRIAVGMGLSPNSTL